MLIKQIETTISKMKKDIGEFDIQIKQLGEDKEDMSNRICEGKAELTDVSEKLADYKVRCDDIVTMVGNDMAKSKKIEDEIKSNNVKIQELLKKKETLVEEMQSIDVDHEHKVKFLRDQLKEYYGLIYVKEKLKKVEL